jgi:hypothetical protein
MQIRVGSMLRSVTVALLLGAAGIHFGVMGEHAGVSWTHGLFFAAVAWAQLGFAAAWLFRPSRLVAVSTVVFQLGVLGVWVVSRTAGIAVGGDGTPEPWGAVDGLCAGFEIAAVLCSLLWFRARLSRRLVSRRIGFAGAGAFGAAVAVLATLAFTPALAGSDEDHANGHGAAHATAAPADHTHHEVAPVDDKGLSALSNGHHDVIGLEKPLTVAQRTRLSQQIAATIEVARRFPTVAAATAAGYRRAGPYSPGLGAHYVITNANALNPDGVMDEADLANPLAIIFDGVTPDSRVAGFMYYSLSAEKPGGFAGPNDHWHYHTSVCLKYGADGIDSPFGADREVTEAQCEAAGGSLLKQTQWMVHVWSVPGWESAQGLFGEVNPALVCPDGTYHVRPVSEWPDHPLNACRGA